MKKDYRVVRMGVVRNFNSKVDLYNSKPNQDLLSQLKSMLVFLRKLNENHNY